MSKSRFVAEEKRIRTGIQKRRRIERMNREEA